tara:strand:+ start:7924 stop:8373 length:450 start_codon:yes stop_codon:yes gene_type:complete
MINWKYQNEDITNVQQLEKEVMGFVYRIDHIPSGKSYVGKKFLVFTRKQKLGKKELKIFEGQKGRPPKFKVVTKESDWKTYWSSNKYLVELVKQEPEKNFKRTIICLCTSKKELTYMETKWQFLYEVLEKPTEFFNDNILGKFFTKDFN